MSQSNQDLPYLAIVPIKNAIEEGVTWEDYAADPLKLFADFARFFAVQASSVNDNIIRSNDVPLAKDRNKLWIKTSWPYGIGALIDGVYKMNYAINGYPVGVPFMAYPIVPAQDYIREMGAQELQDAGITDTKSDAVKRMKWYIFQPPEINI